MEDKDLLIMLIKDYLEKKITIEIFQRYYFNIFNFFIDYDELNEYYYSNFNKVSELVDFYVDNAEVEYPYFNSRKYFDEKIYEIYNNLI
ncbi:hypothetical protein [Macrococcoides bohemicum]|uniref:hypothetical protein n=1 Tax=Staphylococcaceae TaxID=90964 RepID=UPI001C604D9E|nr:MULTISPECIES: hypothetical protein [Macrococcus]MCH4983771.1 hypothetical protein [Macrococcus sp. PK]QYA46061.1 hypothetical protein KYI13_12805 [Macrococcus bohemicus]